MNDWGRLVLAVLDLVEILAEWVETAALVLATWARSARWRVAEDMAYALDEWAIDAQYRLACQRAEYLCVRRPVYRRDYWERWK